MQTKSNTSVQQRVRSRIVRSFCFLAIAVMLLIASTHIAHAATPACANVTPRAGLGEALTGNVSQTGDELNAIICAPKPRIQIPGLSFTDPSDEDKLILQSNTDESVTLSVPFLGEYLAAVYRYSVAIISILAVIMIIIGGVQWMIPGGDNIDAAKKKILGAIAGLVLAVGSYTLLYNINPVLTSFKSLTIEYIRPIPLEFFEHAGDVEDSGTTGPTAADGGVGFFDSAQQATNFQPAARSTAVCRGKENCRQWCAAHRDRSSWPSHTRGMLDPSLTQRGFSAPGIRTRSNRTMVPLHMIEGLRAVGQAAQNHPEGPFTIVITSAYRPLSRQIELVCPRYTRLAQAQQSGTPQEVARAQSRVNSIGSAVAWPGTSNHGKGTAVDVLIKEDRTNRYITDRSFSFRRQTRSQYTRGIRILAQVFYSVPGWKRYLREIWHFEYNGGSSCRTNTCTVAAPSRGCRCPS